MIFCIGSLFITEQDSADPSLIIRFGKPEITFYFQMYTNYCSAHGDHSDPAYPECVPPAINAFLGFVGPVTYHHTMSSTGPRMFGVDVSVYNTIKLSVAVSAARSGGF